MSRRPVTTVGLQFAGYSFAGVLDSGIFERVTQIALRAEASGFDSLWTMDHVQQIGSLGERDEPILEAYTTLAALAALTSSVRLGVLVSACGFRNPALLAKMVTTIDVISGGRAVLGIGAGWLEEEYHAYGLPFPPARARLEELADAVAVCRAMFQDDEAEVTGRAHSVRGALNNPRPVTDGGPPILIGGGGEKVLIPLVARLGDACNFFGAPATVRHKLAVLERACVAVGRDPDEITKTWLGPAAILDSEEEVHEALERMGRLLGVQAAAAQGFVLCGTEHQVERQVAAYRDVGVEGLIVTVLDPGDLDMVERVGLTLRKAMHV